MLFPFLLFLFYISFCPVEHPLYAPSHLLFVAVMLSPSFLLLDVVLIVPSFLIIFLIGYQHKCMPFLPCNYVEKLHAGVLYIHPPVCHPPV